MENFLMICKAVIFATKQQRNPRLITTHPKIKKAMCRTVNNKLHEHLFETDENYLRTLNENYTNSLDHYYNTIADEGANQR